MTGTVTPRRPTRPQAAVVGLVLVTISALGAGLLLQADLGASPRSAPAAGAAGSPGSSADASPGLSGEDWAAVELGALPVVASLEATEQDAAGVAPEASFTLASRSAEPAAAIAERLDVSPATEFTIAPSADGRTATLTPSSALAAGRAYRVALRAEDGTLAGSWAFHVRGPVNVASTVPGDTTTNVPLRTGVEVTFDQDDVASMQTHFTITPAVDGTFEQHGRTQVFVPASLRPATLYTVTIRRGLARTGTDLVLEEDVIIRFETEGTGGPPDRLLRFGRDVVEVVPGERPVVAVNAILPDGDDDTSVSVPTTATINVYRLPSLDVAGTTLDGFLAAPRWGEFSDPLMPTDGLPVVMRFEANLEALGDHVLLARFPAALEEGWYVIEIPGTRVAHAFMQVTPISAWVAVQTDRTVVWVNDVATGRAVRQATVTLEGGGVVGRSDADGLMVAATPARIVPPAAVDPDGEVTPSSPILRVTSPAGKVVLVPFGVAGYGDTYRGEWYEKSTPADAAYWSASFTDRGVYRSDDTIQVWGYLRGRDGGVVPSTVEVRLVTAGGGRTPGAPSMVSVEARPGPDGSFTSALRFAGMPLGGYEVQTVVDGRVVMSRWVEVTIIRKPAYQLALVPDHSAVIDGEAVTWTATATFFDQSPVPATDLRFQGDLFDEERTQVTDAAGRASLSAPARADAQSETAEQRSLDVVPAGPEGGEIGAGASVLVFPSAYDLDADGVIEGKQLVVEGSLHAVDLAKVERAIAAETWSGDAAGDAIVNKRIAVTVTELIPVRRHVGNDYDFISKAVRPRYEYEIERKVVDTLTIRSARDGRIGFDLSVPNAAHGYEVVLSTTDAAERVARRTIDVGAAFKESSDQGVVFEEDGQIAGQKAYGIGDRLTWRMTDDGRALPDGGPNRYLYIVSQRGLRSAVVTDSATLRHTFEAADAPGVFIIGVHFSGTTYAPKAATWADFDREERALKVDVTADRERYRPGEAATVSVRTTDPDGRPVAASVILQAVDEKLYAMGGASVPRPLDDLYGRVDSGILRLTATHQVPGRSGPEGEGGDATGGGRSDFKDTLVFRELRTDATGRASTRIALSDDLTAWHVTAGAVTADLRAGTGELAIPVGLPLFVEATVADAYLVSDRATIEVRAFGDALRAGDPVEFSLESPSLGLASTRLTGKAFEPIAFDLPVLSLGTRSVVVGATATTRTAPDGDPLTDRLTRTFDVVESRLTTARTAHGTVGDDIPSIPGSTGLTTYTFTDAGRGSLVPLLLDLARSGGARLDRLVAQAVARRLLIESFGRTAASLPPLDLDPSRYQISEGGDEEGDAATAGVALLPWSGPDPWLAVQVALTAPNELSQNSLRAALLAIRGSSATERDLQIAALAGLAALGEPVLTDLRAAEREPDLTTMDRLYLALGFVAVGDDASAIAIERDLLAREGERLGTWVRLRVGSDLDATLEVTSWLAVVAAGVGDPLAAGMADYIAANPAPETVLGLALAAYATRVLERTPVSAASFAYTVNGERTIVSLQPGEAFGLDLTGEQRSTLRLEPVGGQVGVVVEGRVLAGPATLDPHPDLSIARVTPDDPVAADRIVVVDLTATFAASVPSGCYDVVELVPSGLAPLTSGVGNYDETDETGAIGVVWPTSVVGQEVRFCADNDARTGHTAHLRYRARVVNEGTFAWEPAVMQLPGAPELLAVTPGRTVVIGGR